MPKSPTLVSVLIPAYNVSAIIGRAIGSALSQSHRELEVVVVDDASDDATSAMVQDVAKEDPRVRLVHCDRNVGPGAARALALEQARGAWVAPLDADDTFHPERIQRLLAVAQARKLQAIADNILFIDPGSEADVGRAYPLSEDDDLALSPQTFLANSVPGGRVMMGWMKPVYDRQFLLSHGLTWRDLRHAEDFLLAMEVLLSGARFHLIGWSGYRYTQRRGTRTGKPSPFSRAQRSVADQIRAIDVILADYGSVLTAAQKRALRERKPQIEVTAAVLDALDHWRDGHFGAAVRRGAQALGQPIPLIRCINARYGRRSGIVAG